MELQEINVFIDKNGEVILDINGVKGMGCLDLTQELEAILGGEVIKRELTSEAHQVEQQESQQEQEWQWG
ncbi:DUF2997 domain-containing protein [Synechocystis sp. PCC 7339]|uniref:DUF2997 domain-containing protein n=1 Tax=unclassified Synechocystis TaxID=2640012 RepID=UPI001BB092EB|nr:MULTISPECIES: DUF2997 domain-containing protein [unclassified Synechocystis]QUS61726.1 DUF2997 domain-containing protein [Synechocystis sp. PCC 7338]UAJ73924.1 DUF2997 domain-containing protein [Synechocystis sp. PCC 7339]